MTQRVFVVDAVRTPIGRYGGALSAVRPDDLAALVIHQLVQRSQLDPAEIDEVVLGCANQAGEDNRNIARMALLLAGLPDGVPGHTVNRLCASGLDAVAAGYRQIALQEADVVLAGGVESMSRAPLVLGKTAADPLRGNQTMYDSALGWRFPNPKLQERFPLEAMGETAENLAERHAISRADQDAFALRSHQLAIAAAAAGRFADALVAVTVPSGKQTITVDQDEGPRSDTSLESLAKLRPAFRSGGTVTAGNSSTLNDGAACLLLASQAAVQRHGWQPLAEVMGAAQSGVDPRVMGIGPVPAVHKLLQRLGWSVADLDSIELNEAFAAQALAVMRALDLDPSKVNPDGGAIALGHPLGCSGARIAGQLAWRMQRQGLRRGVATLCVGVGQGVALALQQP
jgi:acetyl-CoA acyltransferase